MNTKKQALVAILLVLWISGLWSQLHSWKTTTLYLLLTLLMITAGALTGRFKPNRLDAARLPRRRKLSVVPGSIGWARTFTLDYRPRLRGSSREHGSPSRFHVSNVHEINATRFSYPRWLFAICFSPRNPELFLPSSDLIPFFNKVLLISSTFFHASSFRITSRA